MDHARRSGAAAVDTERELAAGDVLWTDVSITYQGYCSDFGRTWIVGQEPTPRQQAQYHKWRESWTPCSR